MEFVIVHLLQDEHTHTHIYIYIYMCKYIYTFIHPYIWWGPLLCRDLWKVMFIAIEEPVFLTLHCEDDPFNMGMLPSMWNNEARPAVMEICVCLIGRFILLFSLEFVWPV